MNLTRQHKQNHTLRGRAVVWVHNTNYPNAKKTVYSKKDGKAREVTISKFYPLFRRTPLPAEFNQEGQNVIDNAKKMLEARKPEIEEALRACVQKHLKKNGAITVK